MRTISAVRCDQKRTTLIQRNFKKTHENSGSQTPNVHFFFGGGSFFCLSINNLFFSNDTFLEIHHPFGSSNADSTCALASSKSAAKTCGGIIVTQSATWPRDTACYWTNIQKRNTQRKNKNMFSSHSGNQLVVQQFSTFSWIDQTEINLLSTTFFGRISTPTGGMQLNPFMFIWVGYWRISESALFLP